MSNAPEAKKALGQHWLHDQATLESITNAADLKPDDVVLEIGPGTGSLTKLLVGRVKKVVAVEFDAELAHDLPARVPADNLEIHHKDIMRFDLTTLPTGYKVVANIPYYLTSNLLRILCEATNPPICMVLLVQKDVAKRVAAAPGDMSLLSVSVQFYCHVELGQAVPAKLFDPPPKVDSQVLVMRRREAPPFKVNERPFFSLVKAGFSARRKTLLNSLSGGLRLGKEQVNELLKKATINPKVRPQELSLTDWYNIAKHYEPQD